MSIIDEHTKPKRLELLPLTGIRALAAAWVLLYHLKSEIAVAFPEWKFITNPFIAHGYLGVDLFFTLSGFILSYNYKEKFKNNDYGRFLWMRLARIYPVHLTVLFIYVAALIVVKVLSIRLTLEDIFTPASFFQNLFLVQAWGIPTTLSWNAPAWSISCEWLVYLLFPIFIAYFRFAGNIRLWVTLVICSILVIASPVILPFQNTSAFGVIRVLGEFIIGMGMYEFFLKGYGSRLNWNRVLSVCVAGIFFLPLLLEDYKIKMFLVAPLFGVVILGLAYNSSYFSRICSLKIVLIGGYLSYSMYMIHEIILLVFRKLLRSPAVLEVEIAYPLAVPVIFSLSWFAAFLLYKFIEEPARVWMRSCLK